MPFAKVSMKSEVGSEEPERGQTRCHRYPEP